MEDGADVLLAACARAGAAATPTRRHWVLYSESKFYSYLENLAFFRVVRVAPPPSLRVRPAVVDVRKALQALLIPPRLLGERAPLLLLLRRGRHVEASGHSGSDELFSSARSS